MSTRERRPEPSPSPPAGHRVGSARPASTPARALQRTLGNGSLSRILHAGAAPGGGEPLPTPIAKKIATELGGDLSAVRVHAGLGAQRLARAEGAGALARGDDVYFGRRRYRPFEPGGRRLLRHELAHVLQQRMPGPAAPAATLEGQAERVADGADVALSAADASTPLRTEAAVREVIEDELDDVVFDIDNAWPLIRQEPDSARSPIRNDADLERRIRARADPMELLRTYLLLTFQTESAFPPHFTAFLDATDIAGTHEARIFAILRGVTESERSDMRDMPGVVEVLDDELSGGDLDLASALLSTGEDVTGIAASSVRSSTRLESGKRYELGREARDDLEDVESNLQQVSREETSDVILNDLSLWAQFADEFDPEEVWYLRMIARYNRWANFPRADGETRPFAQVIWEAVEPAGTDEEVLIGELEKVHNSTSWVAGGAGCTLEPQPEDEVKNEAWFVPMLEEELSGEDLQRALDALSAAGTADDPNRDALEDAIDDEDLTAMATLVGTLSPAERAQLAHDPVILDELGEELEGVGLCEAVQLLTHGVGGSPALVTDLLPFFRQDPIDVTGAVAHLVALSAADQDALREEPGVYYMLTTLDVPRSDRARLLAAIRSHDPLWQTPSSAGLYRATTSSVTTELPVTFAGSEVRVNVRFDLDVSNVPEDQRPDSSVLESWTSEIGEVWNGRFRVRSGTHRLDLVFNAYFAVGVAPPNVPVILAPGHGRASASSGGMRIFLQGQASESETPAETIAHEFGHVVGNPDEYALTPAEYAQFAGEPGETPAPGGGETVEGLMGNQHESTEVAERHMGPALEIINLVRDVTVFPDPFVLEAVED